MIREKMNREWLFTKGSPSLMSSLTDGSVTKYERISLPHDAMVHEERTPDTGNGTQTGYYPGGLYTYIKKLYAPAEWQHKTVMLEFEGVYATSMVYVNGDLAATQLYGYSGFYVVLDKYLEYGQENEILVIADNAAEKNSRWYSGSGIYRNVNLLIGAEIHIPADGVRIQTPSVAQDASAVEITTDIRNISRQKKRSPLRPHYYWKANRQELTPSV